MATPQQQEDMVRDQAAVWGCIFGYVETMALRCAVKLGIPDIISSHGHPMSLTQIANAINLPSTDNGRLARVLTILVRRGIFTASTSESEDSSSTSTVYGLTAASEMLLSGSIQEKSLAPMAIMLFSEFWLSVFQHMDDHVKDGSTFFTKRHGMDAWSYMSADPDLSADFHQSLTGLSKIVMETLKIGYLKEGGLQGVGSLVDVGGGSGATVSEIVRGFPRIKGINFDLPFVVAAAPECPGVTHIAGDMLVSVPHADAVMIKLVLHNWDDESCAKILTNCRKAIPEETGKVIIMDMVLDPYGKDPLEHTRAAFDLLMMVSHGTKERTRDDWEKLLQRAGFSRCNFIKIPTFVSVIEAYPEISSSV